MKKKFTILTIVKNNKVGISKTLNSVLNQTFQNFEYIVIDGNSHDGTFYEIKKMQLKKKFKLVRRKDLSFYDSLNYGISISNGKFVGILNSGDVLINNRILEQIDKKLSQKTELFYTNVIFKRKNNPVRYWKHKISKINKFNVFKIPHTTLFLKKKKYFETGLYNIKFKISSDLDFLIRLSKSHHHIQHIDLDSIFMELGGLSTSLKNFKTKFIEDFKILFFHYKLKFIFFYMLKIYFKIGDFKLKKLFA